MLLTKVSIRKERERSAKVYSIDGGAQLAMRCVVWSRVQSLPVNVPAGTSMGDLQMFCVIVVVQFIFSYNGYVVHISKLFSTRT